MLNLVIKLFHLNNVLVATKVLALLAKIFLIF